MIATPFRRAKLADVAEIRALVDRAYSPWVPVAGREPKPMATDYDDAVRRHIVHLAEVDDRLAGLIVLVAEPDQLLIDNVAVCPTFQRRGLGRALLDHAEAVAATRQLHRTRLFTNQLFTVNIDLYRGIGYRIDREEQTNGFVRVHMSKDLRQPSG